jgi:putative hydrolase of the HAD superfamily
MVVDAVLFDWGGTLTPWCPPTDRIWLAVARALVPVDRAESVASRLEAADAAIWQRSRLEHRSGTIAEVFAAADLPATTTAYEAFAAAMEPTTYTDPDVSPLLSALRERGVRVGVLSNTTWPRAHHERIFARDGVLELIDGAVYTSEIPWTKPHPEAFRAAMAAVGVSDASRCVFVGDRTFDDIHGAGSVGMRTVLVPHSRIPAEQRGHTDGVPDAVVQRLADLLAVVDGWR